jgi:hypothetical protein
MLPCTEASSSQLVRVRMERRVVADRCEPTGGRGRGTFWFSSPPAPLLLEAEAGAEAEEEAEKEAEE